MGLVLPASWPGLVALALLLVALCAVLVGGVWRSVRDARLSVWSVVAAATGGVLIGVLADALLDAALMTLMVHMQASGQAATALLNLLGHGIPGLLLLALGVTVGRLRGAGVSMTLLYVSLMVAGVTGIAGLARASGLVLEMGGAEPVPDWLFWLQLLGRRVAWGLLVVGLLVWPAAGPAPAEESR